MESISLLPLGPLVLWPIDYGGSDADTSTLLTWPGNLHFQPLVGWLPWRERDSPVTTKLWEPQAMWGCQKMRHPTRERRRRGQGCPGGRCGRTRTREGAVRERQPRKLSGDSSSGCSLAASARELPCQTCHTEASQATEAQGRRHCYFKPRSLGAAGSAALITQTPSPPPTASSENRTLCFRTERSFASCNFIAFIAELEWWRE